MSQTNLALSGNITLTSDEALSFVTLSLNDSKLTLGSSTDNLTVQNAITIDASTEGISDWRSRFDIDECFDHE